MAETPSVIVGVLDGAIVIHFGAPVTWIQLDASEAELLAVALFQKAQQLRKEAVGSP